MNSFLYKRIRLVLFFFLAVVPSCVSSDASKIPYDIHNALGVENLVPVVAIGSGPAGLSAALYTARANFYTIVIEGKKRGGQLTETSYVENWPGVKRTLGRFAVAQVREQAAAYGAEFLADHVTSVDFTQWPFVIRNRSGLELRAMTVVIGTGVTPRKLGIPGEQKYWGAGVTACAICDAPLYNGEEVVVIGGGDAAAEEATQLAGYASKVTVLVRKGKMRAAHAMQERLKDYDNIFVKYNLEVQEILGDGEFVTGVRLRNNLTGEISDFATNGVFLAIGRDPNSQIFADYLDMDAIGHINVIGRSQATTISGVFAAGDVANPDYKQAGVAAGDGVKAGLDVSRYLVDLGLSEKMARQLEPTFFRDGKTDEEMADVEHLSSEQEFEDLVLKSSVPVILDFYTEYCPSCLEMLPKIARVSEKYKGKINVYKVDAEQAIGLVKELSVPKVPYLLGYSDGRMVIENNKDMTEEELEKLFADLIK